MVSLSSAEAELTELCDGHVGTLNIMTLVNEIEGDETERKRVMAMGVDNTAAIALCNPVESGISWRTRHLRIRAAAVREQQAEKGLTIEHCPGRIQIADLLTKSLDQQTIEKLRRLAGMAGDSDLVELSRNSRVRIATVPVQVALTSR